MMKTNTLKVAAITLALTLAGTGTVIPSVNAAESKSPIKKTMDGRCLTPNHPDYWKTNIYVAKPSLEACVASGGRKA